MNKISKVVHPSGPRPHCYQSQPGGATLSLIALFLSLDSQELTSALLLLTEHQLPVRTNSANV